jgi:GMP synthase (glutamine-hydrolysing)
MDYKAIVEEQVDSIRTTVADGLAINARRGGIGSSVVTVLGHRAPGDRLRTLFLDNAPMRQGEPEWVVQGLAGMRIPVEVGDARVDFLRALAGLTDPKAKRNALAATKYDKLSHLS